MAYSFIFLAVYEHDRGAVAQRAGLQALCSVTCTQASCNPEMQILEDSFKISFSGSASLTGALADCQGLLYGVLQATALAQKEL